MPKQRFFSPDTGSGAANNSGALSHHALSHGAGAGGPGAGGPGAGGATGSGGGESGVPTGGQGTSGGQGASGGQGTHGSLHLRLPGTPDALPLIRQHIVEAAERCQFGPEDIAKIEMAVGEACTNVIEHAYRTQPLRLEIEVQIDELDNRLEVTIIDYSTINFPVDNEHEFDLDDFMDSDRRRGLGLYIIRNFVDHLEHRFICGQGNELRLIKYFA